MEEDYIYIATVGDWKDKLKEDRVKLMPNEEGKINDPVSFLIYKEFYEKGTKPSRIYLLATTGEKGTKPAAQKIKNKWIDVIADTRCDGYEVDAFDMEKTTNVIDKILREIPKDKKVIVNLTGGTKKMVIASILKFFEISIKNPNFKIFFVEAERDAPGELTNFEKMKLIPIETESMNVFYDKLINSGHDNLNIENFSTAIVLFKHGRKILNVFESEKANFFYELSKAFLEWDQFEYGTSLNHLKSAKEIIEKFKYEKLYEEWYNFIDKKINFLSSILNNSKLFKLFFTFDLFENALRKFRKSELKEVVLPLYRSIESLMEWRLLDKYNYARDKEINNVFPNEKLDKIIRTYKEKMQKEDIKIDYEGAKTRLLKLPIYLKEMEAILEALDDELYLEFKKYLMSEKDYVEVLRNWRNFHPLIHGGSEKKIDTKLLDKIIGQYYNFLKHQFGSKFNEYREITKLKIYNENDFLKSYIHH